MNDALLKSECFVHWHRDVTQSELRYIRAMFAPPNTRPGPLALAHRTVLGWTLNSTGDCVRLLYLGCLAGPDGHPDGCGDYHPDPSLKDAEAGLWAGIRKPLGPMRPLDSSAAFMAEERLARRSHAEHWILFFERQAANDARLRQQAAEEAGKQAAEEAAKQAAKQAELAKAPVTISVKAKPKTFLQRLVGK